MMGNQLKGEDNSLTLQIRGDGPLGGITCVSDSQGNVRGYVVHPQADVARKQEGKLDVGAAVGEGDVYKRQECTGAICPSALCLWPDGADNSPRHKRRPERGF